MYIGPKITTNGLIYYFDAANTKSYPGTGTITKNVSGQPVSGTLQNSPVFSSSFGGCLTFNGSTQFITLETNSTLNIPSGSIETWARCNDITSSLVNTVSSRTGTTAGTFNLLKAAPVDGNEWRFRVRTSDALYNVGTNEQIDQQWNHVVGTQDSASMKIYVNGVLKNTLAQTGSINTAAFGGSWIGNNGGSTAYFNGDIAIVKIYNRALTQDEILNNYNATKGRFGY